MALSRLAALALVLGQEPAPPAESVETLERTRQALEFRTNTTPGNLDPALALIDSAVRRKALTNPHHAEDLAPAARVPLAHEEPPIAADELDGRFVLRESARLELHFGPHLWSARAARGR